MIALSSAGELIGAISHARDVSLTGYVLPRGRILAALEDAARAGARVRVRLEGALYKDNGARGAANAATIAALRAAGADAQLVYAADEGSGAVLHAKTALVDGALFLDDRNWTGSGDTIVRDDPSSNDAVFTKRAALGLEAQMLRGAQRGDEVVAESESFGPGNPAFAALDAAARGGAHVRALVNAREARANPRELAALRKLEADGASVRIGSAFEKFALDDASGWIGSANATAAFDVPDQRDWGACTNDPALIGHLHETFERQWSGARALA
jgi:phosphatidylserine/phosphatidylglycerophosphate/cardiolipin synthase-like enzyme